MHTREDRDNMSAGEHRNRTHVGEHRDSTHTREHWDNISAGEHRDNIHVGEHKNSIHNKEHWDNISAGEHRDNAHVGEHSDSIYIYIHLSIYLSIHPYQGTPMDGEHRIRLSEHGSNYICVRRSQRRPMMRLMSNSQLDCRNHAET